LIRRLLKPLPLLFCALILMLSSNVTAGVSGKISGVIMDQKTGEPIVGATVRVLGTSHATETDVDGEYFIINVPVGKFDISVTNVGFEQVIKKDVRVLLDLTTPVDFELAEQPVELGQQLVVYATSPVIQKDLTASKVIFTSDRLKTLPNIVSVQSVLTNYPGVIIDRDNNLHVRGGRTGQVSYYYDGFSVQDPFFASSGMAIFPGALEELSLTSGGYTAEYGEALSGVVSAVTREGGSEYHGGFRYYRGFTHAFDVNTSEWSDLKSIGNQSGSVRLSGPVPGLNPDLFTFSSAGEYLNDPTCLPNNGRESYSGTAKIAMQPLPSMKMVANLAYNERDGKLYDHRDVNGISYDFNLDGLPSFEQKSYLVGLSSNYNINPSTVISAAVNRFYTRYHGAPTALMDLYWTEWPGYSEDSAGNYDGTIDDDNYGGDVDYTDMAQVTGFTTGDDFNPIYRFRESAYNALQLSLVNQLDKRNQLKTGLEYRKYSVEWDNKQFYNDNPYGERYTSKPTYLSIFVQDKMEYDAFVINVGARYDYINADVSYNVTPYELEANYQEADAKSKVSPRLGVSFPIGEKSVMHFNYGYYYQTPRYTYMYTNMDGDVSTGYPLLGNPDLEPEQTVSYELGLDHMLGDNLRLDITAYYKDITDLVATRSNYKVAGNAVTFFDNDDFGTVKGVDISLEKLPMAGYLTGSVSYSYMIARGVGSSATDAYYSYLTSLDDTLPPLTSYPLDYDQRHTLAAVLDYRVPSNWGLNVVGHYGSGLPYTVTDESGERLGDWNAGRLSANYTVDMRFNKDFRVGTGNLLASFFVEVDNVFNKRNVLDLYSRTGEADDDGNQIVPTLGVSVDDIEYWDSLYDYDPQHYSPPRTIRTGIEFNF